MYVIDIQTDRQLLSQKRSISAGEMYPKICVEWDNDYRDLSLT